MPRDERSASPEEVIELIRTSRAEIDTILAGPSDERMTETRDDGGWSIKDHLAHSAEWQKHALAVLSGTPAYEARGIDPESHARLDIDDLNEILYQRNRCRPLSEVLQDFHQTHEEGIRIVARMSESELQRRLPPDIAMEAVRVMDVVIGTFARHNSDHVEDIRELARR